MSNALATLTGKLASTLGMGDHNGAELMSTLKATAFKGQVTDAQMTALLVVAQQYGLNPWTKEIYAFQDKGGIVPVVGVDGWSRIINTHPQFDGMDFAQDNEGCTCIIYRKDRAHPVKVTEWMSECKRDTQPWKSHPKRMLRHKAMIQCARLAFGYGGIYDQDEAERITTGDNILAAEQTEDRADLLTRAQAAAEGGIESYKEFWKAASKQERTSIGEANHLELRAMAEAADARTVNVEATEVPA